MRTIIVGFSKSSLNLPLGSWAIRLYERTPFSHIYLRFPSTSIDRSDTIVHASEGLVWGMSHTQFIKRHETVQEFSITISEEMYDKILTRAHEFAGEQYSIMQNVGIVLVDFVRFFTGRTIKNPWRTGFNCSELVLVLLEETAYAKKFSHLRRNTVTPKDLYNVLCGK